MRQLPSALAVDASILISALLGTSAEVVFTLADQASLLTTQRAVEEASRRTELGLRRPDLLPALDELASIIEVIPVTDAELLAEAEVALRDATPSRNGSVRDAHLLALAWDANADIWSHDRDFCGTGVAIWSTLNLLRALAIDSIRS
ncbi:MAG: PIN domain-containing protein [Caulobacteraceae bacterium]